MTSKKSDLVKMEPVPPVASPPLLEDLRRMIEETPGKVLLLLSTPP
jgi:hypothetical protein